MNEAIYLYGFVPAGVALPAAGLLGVADRAVELLDLVDFGAVISRVPADEYAPARVEARLRDLEWVGRQGLRHEQVVTWFVDHGQILPVRFLTLYSSVEALRREASGRSAQIRERLECFAGQREWDLKIAYSSERLIPKLGRLSEGVAALDAEIAAAAPGKRFLLERKRAELVRAEAARAARRLAEELVERLGGHAVKSRSLPIPREGAELPVVLNVALLVRADREEALRAEVQARAAEAAGFGLEAVFSGPWAPYRFLGEDR